MKYKYLFLFYFSLILIKTAINHEVVGKYDDKTIDQDYLFLDVSDFDKGDNIYFSSKQMVTLITNVCIINFMKK